MVPHTATANKTAEELANEQGWHAYRSNTPFERNPYPSTSELHVEWNFGWKQGEYDSWSPE